MLTFPYAFVYVCVMIICKYCRLVQQMASLASQYPGRQEGLAQASQASQASPSKALSVLQMCEGQPRFLSASGPCCNSRGQPASGKIHVVLIL